MPCVIVHSLLRIHIPLTVCFSTGLLSFIVPPSLAPSGGSIWLGVLALVFSVLNPLSEKMAPFPSPLCNHLPNQISPRPYSPLPSRSLLISPSMNTDFLLLNTTAHIHNLKGNVVCTTKAHGIESADGRRGGDEGWKERGKGERVHREHTDLALGLHPFCPII